MNIIPGGERNGTIKRVLGVYEGKEEVLVIADYYYSYLTGSADSLYRVKRCSAIYLCSVLRRTNVYTWNIGVLS